MKKITIIGVGALGSHLVQAIRNEDVAIEVIDFDRVEMKNVASQFHFKNAVGKKKTDALKAAMQFCYGRRIETVGNKVTSDNVSQLLGDADLIVDCMDNGDSRRLVQAFAQKEGIPCLHGALAADGVFGRVIWTEFFVADDDTSGAPTCEDGEFLPFIGMVSMYLAVAVQKFLHQGQRVGFSVAPSGAQKI